jgi:hypothetical protein
MAWQQTNKYGFRLERYTVMRGGKALSQPEKRIIAEQIKAQPLEKWESIAVSDDYAAVIAQALYGETFELSGGNPQSLTQIINLSQQLEQRFAMSLFAADRNFEAACMAGWGWKDTEVSAGEKYLYRIIPLTPPSVMKPDTGLVYTGTNEYEPLPQPQELAAVFGDHSVMLTWNYETMSDVYNSYFIEKSEDGVHFERLPGLPFSNINNRGEKTAQRMFFSDSLSHNNITYYYRICGVNAFGETGPPSEAVSGSGRDLLTFVPHITRAVINDRGTMELEWEFDERGNDLISGFELNRSIVPNDGYVTVQRDIAPALRQITFADLLPSNYFTVSAVPKNGAPSVSFPVLVQPLDSIPPAVPVSLAGNIDTTGIVTLHWAANKEQDMLGYKVYRSLRKGDEMLPLFDLAWQDTVYRDSVNVRNLNTRVWYSVVAVDMRYNQSAHSELLEIVKPVLVPPSAPVFSAYRITEAGIVLEWINSPDETVAEHRLYRRVKNAPDSAEQLLKRFDGASVQTYTDADIEPEVRYVYTLTAACDNGLESPPAQPLTVFSNLKNNRDIARFEAAVNKRDGRIKLTWSNNLNEVRMYELYKSVDGQPPTLWQTPPATATEITDENVQAGNYLYLIRAIDANGKNSKTKSVTVKW